MRKAFNKKSSRIGIPIEIPVASIPLAEKYNKRPKRKVSDRKEEDAREEERVKTIRNLLFNNSDTVEDKSSSFTKPKPRRFEHLDLLEASIEKKKSKAAIVVGAEGIDTSNHRRRKRDNVHVDSDNDSITKTRKKIRQIPSFSDGEDELDADEYLHEPKGTSSLTFLSKMKPKVLSLLPTEAESTEKQTGLKNTNKQPKAKLSDHTEKGKILKTGLSELEDKSFQDKNISTKEMNTTMEGYKQRVSKKSPNHIGDWFLSRKSDMPKKETMDVDNSKTNNFFKKEQFSFFDSDNHILMYPFSGPRQHTVLWEDAERLKEDRYLNDTIIDLYPRIWNDQYPTNKIHTFSSFFFAKLKECHTDEDFKLLSKWTKGTNLFEKDLLIIPIAENHHWFLALIINPGACVRLISEDVERPKDQLLNKNKPYILVVDSLGGKQRHVRKSLTTYLCKEAQEKLGSDEDNFFRPEFISISSPLQDNYYDCGVYSLYTIYSLYKKTSEMFASIYDKKSIIDDDEERQQNKLKNYRGTLYRLLAEKSKEYAAFKSHKRCRRYMQKKSAVLTAAKKIQDTIQKLFQAD